jgi:hypothetical protein
MKWIVVKGTHINTNRIDTFYWRDGQLWVCFASCLGPTTWDDPDRVLYVRMCQALGVRPDEEDDEGGKN